MAIKELKQVVVDINASMRNVVVRKAGI